MRKKLVLIIFLFPCYTLAADRGLTFGLERYDTVVKNKIDENRLLWAFSYQQKVNKYFHINIAGGIDTSSEKEGTVAHGDILIKRVFKVGEIFTPYIQGGLSTSVLSEKTCGMVYTQVAGGIFGQTECDYSNFSSAGFVYGIGINIKLKEKSVWSIKFLQFRGNKNTLSQIIGLEFVL